MSARMARAMRTLGWIACIYTSSNHRLSGSHVGRSGHWVVTAVKGDLPPSAVRRTSERIVGLGLPGSVVLVHFAWMAVERLGPLKGRPALPIVGGMNIPFAIPECRVAHRVERHDDYLVVPVRLDAASGRCPDCGRASRSVHSRYHRHPADCRSRHRGPRSASRCGGSTASTRPADAEPSPRRLRTSSHRAPGARGGLGEVQARVGLACGGAGGARLLTHIHMPASRATVLRLITRMPMPDAPAPIRVGI